MDTIEYVVGFVVATSLRFAPLFFLSVGLAAVVKALPIARVASRWLAQREHASVVAGSLLGTFSPFCSCTVVPVVRSLLVAGAPLAGVMAFWVASPLMDPEIFVLSVGLLGWDIAVARVVAALALAMAAGYGAVVAVRRGWLPASAPPSAPLRAPLSAPPNAASTSPVSVASPSTGEPAVATVEEHARVGARPAVAARAPMHVPVGLPLHEADACCGSAVPTSAARAGDCGTADGCGDGDRSATDRDDHGAGDCGGSCDTAAVTGGERRGVVATLRELDWEKVRADFLTESWHIGRWILLAFALEALILRFVPQEALVAVLGSDAPWAVPLAALLGIPLYMDSFSALPVVSGLLQQGMAPGAAIAFLLAGPVTTVPAITAVRAVLPGPVFRYYLAVSLFGSMALGAAADLVL